MAARVSQGNLFTTITASFGVQVLNQATTFLTRLVLARIILPAEWGVYGEALVIVTMIDTLRELNLTQWATSNRSGQRWDQLPGAIAVTTGLALIGLLAALPFLRVFSPQLPLATAILAVTLIPKTWTLSAEAQLNNRQRLQRLVRPQLVGTAAFIIAAALVSARYRSAWALSVATVVQVSVYSLVLLWSVRREVTLRMRFRHTLASLWSARDFIALALVGVLVGQLDGLVVGGVAGPTAAGYYIMAAWLISRVPSFVEIPLLRTLLPVFAAHKGNAPRLGDLFKRSAMSINYVEAPWAFLLMFNAAFVTQLVLGSRWTAAVPLVTLVAAYPLLSPLGTVGWEVLRMTGKTRLVLAGLVASSLAFIGGGIVLGLRFGVIGVIIAYYAATLINGIVIVVLPTVIGWAKVREVLLEVAVLYVGCAGLLLVIGTLPLTPAIKFAIDTMLMAAVALVGLRPLLPFVRDARAALGRDPTRMAGLQPAPIPVKEATP